MLFTRPKTFISQVKALNKGQIVETELIWRAFEGENAEENISYFCLQLFENVLNSQKKAYLLQNQQRLYATLLCMELYKNKKPKSSQLIEECRNFIEKKASSHGKGFMQFLFSSSREDSLCEFFVRGLVMVPKQIDLSMNIPDQIEKQIKQAQEFLNRIRHSQSHKNYQVLKKVCFPPIQAVQTKILSFGYICFVDHIKNNNNQIKRHEYQYMIKILKILIHGVKTLNIIEEYLPLLIYLIMKCITYHGCFYEDLLKELMIWATQLRSFPGLIGRMGEQLFNVVYGEIKIPGNAFRKRLRKDFPSLDIKENIFLNRDIYFISDGQDTLSCHQDQSLTTLRKLIILHIYKISGLPQSQVKQFKQFLKYLNNQTSYILYDKCIRILEALGKMDNFTNIKISLKEYIGKLVNQSKVRYADAKINEENMETEEFEMLSNKINSFGQFQYPKFSIISVPISDFISNKDNCFSLAKIVEKNKADYQNKGFLKNKIPLIFCGDGYNFIKFVKYIAEYQQLTDIEQVKQFQIYYVPKQESSYRPGVACCLSHKDAWFRRFVFNIYRQKMLYPHLDINNNNKNLFPFYLYKRTIELYLREAHHSMPFRVYRCWLKMSQFQFEQPFYMVSFLRMGLFCEAEIIKMTKEKEKGKEERYFHKQIIEVIEEKIRKIPVMTLSMEVEYVQPLTNYVKVKKEQNMKIEDLQICNLPHEYFMGKEPNPSSPNLQMTILTQSNGKTFRREISHSDNFKDRRSPNEVYNAFKDLFICETIRSVTIVNKDPNYSLRLIIDGTVANKIEKIRIQPAYSTNGLPISIPIQCFLPTN